MFDRFSDAAKKSMNLARREAQRLNYDYISSEHMLLALISYENNTAVAMLVALGVDRAKLRDEILQAVPPGLAHGPTAQMPFWPSAKKALEQAMEEAGRLGDNYIGTMHLLLGLSSEGTSIAARALAGAGATLEQLRAQAKTRVDPESDEVSPSRRAAASEGAPRAEVRRLLQRAEDLLEALAENELADQVCSVRMQLDSNPSDEISELLSLLTSARVALEKRGESAAARALESAILQIAKQR
jgi:ATP-dependent Clp protease ATP-binding subunit ClpC